VLAGRPDDPTYLDAAQDAALEMTAEAMSATFAPRERKHRRGEYAAVSVGISFGNGQLEPSRLRDSTHNAMLARLLKSKAISRLATYASGMFFVFYS
jgi:hypothetical protein